MLDCQRQELDSATVDCVPASTWTVRLKAALAAAKSQGILLTLSEIYCSSRVVARKLQNLLNLCRHEWERPQTLPPSAYRPNTPVRCSDRYTEIQPHD